MDGREGLGGSFGAQTPRVYLWVGSFSPALAALLACAFENLGLVFLYP